MFKVQAGQIDLFSIGNHKALNGIIKKKKKKYDTVRVVFQRVHARSPTGNVHVTRSKLEASRLAGRQFLYTKRREKKVDGDHTNVLFLRSCP